MSTFTLKLGEVDTVVSAPDRQTAFKQFFERVVEDKRIDDIGHVVRLHDGDEKYPMRTVPALYAAGVIEWKRAVANIAEATGVERETRPTGCYRTPRRPMRGPSTRSGMEHDRPR